jgi:hypothetical protein
MLGPPQRTRPLPGSPRSRTATRRTTSPRSPSTTRAGQLFTVPIRSEAMRNTTRGPRRASGRGRAVNPQATTGTAPRTEFRTGAHPAHRYRTTETPNMDTHGRNSAFPPVGRGPTARHSRCGTAPKVKDGLMVASAACRARAMNGEERRRSKSRKRRREAPVNPCDRDLSGTPVKSRPTGHRGGRNLIRRPHRQDLGRGRYHALVTLHSGDPANDYILRQFEPFLAVRWTWPGGRTSPFTGGHFS